jgi:hypothetical protein
MATISKIHPSATYTASVSTGSTSAIKRFFAWCEAQEDYRYLILIGIIMVQGNLLIPAALLTILKSGAAFTGISIYLTGASTLAVLTANLAQVPMKVVISTFLVNVVLLFTLVFLHLSV